MDQVKCIARGDFKGAEVLKRIMFLQFPSGSERCSHSPDTDSSCEISSECPSPNSSISPRNERFPAKISGPLIPSLTSPVPLDQSHPPPQHQDPMLDSPFPSSPSRTPTALLPTPPRVPCPGCGFCLGQSSQKTPLPSRTPNLQPQVPSRHLPASPSTESLSPVTHSQVSILPATAPPRYNPKLLCQVGSIQPEIPAPRPSSSVSIRHASLPKPLGFPAHSNLSKASSSYTIKSTCQRGSLSQEGILPIPSYPISFVTPAQWNYFLAILPFLLSAVQAFSESLRPPSFVNQGHPDFVPPELLSSPGIGVAG